MSTLRRILEEANFTGDFKLLVIGRTGRGKSTLLNAIIELDKEVTAEGAGGGGITHKVESCRFHKSSTFTITLVDSPGFQVI